MVELGAGRPLFLCIRGRRFVRIGRRRGSAIATVTSATPLSTEQLARLERGLQAQSGRPIRFDTIVDPAVLGGIRVQIGDDVIDGSVASRLSSLRQKLAG